MYSIYYTCYYYMCYMCYRLRICCICCICVVIRTHAQRGLCLLWVLYIDFLSSLLYYTYMLAENKTIRLPALMEDCPVYWRRFAEPFSDWPEMQAVLESEYRARPVCVPDVGVPDVDSEHFLQGLVIEFDTAQDLTWFLLKWS